MKLSHVFLLIVALIAACSDKGAKQPESSSQEKTQDSISALNIPVDSSAINPQMQKQEEIKQMLAELNTEEVKGKILNYMSNYLKWIKSDDYRLKMEGMMLDSANQKLTYEQTFAKSQAFIQKEMQKAINNCGFKTLDDLNFAVYCIAQMDSSFAKKINNFNRDISKATGFITGEILKKKEEKY